jgi:hypothetical protein
METNTSPRERTGSGAAHQRLQGPPPPKQTAARAAQLVAFTSLALDARLKAYTPVSAPTKTEDHGGKMTNLHNARLGR